MEGNLGVEMAMIVNIPIVFFCHISEIFFMSVEMYNNLF